MDEGGGKDGIALAGCGVLLEALAGNSRKSYWSSQSTHL